MNSDMMYQMFANAVSKMNDKELEDALIKLKELVSPNDYERISKMVRESRES